MMENQEVGRLPLKGAGLLRGSVAKRRPAAPPFKSLTRGHTVIPDTFRFVGTFGIPLELVLAYFRDHGQVIACDDFVAGALKDGWKPRTIRARTSAAVGDVFGAGYLAEWQPRMDALLNHQRKDAA